jgi:hypothetical protein
MLYSANLYAEVDRLTRRVAELEMQLAQVGGVAASDPPQVYEARKLLPSRPTHPGDDETAYTNQQQERLTAAMEYQFWQDALKPALAAHDPLLVRYVGTTTIPESDVFTRLTARWIMVPPRFARVEDAPAWLR